MVTATMHAKLERKKDELTVRKKCALRSVLDNPHRMFFKKAKSSIMLLHM